MWLSWIELTELFELVDRIDTAWGTPAWTGRGDEREPLRATRWRWQERKSASHLWRLPWIPKEGSLVNSAGCLTISKVCDMSREMALISWLSFGASVHCWESRSSMSSVESPGIHCINFSHKPILVLPQINHLEVTTCKWGIVIPQKPEWIPLYLWKANVMICILTRFRVVHHF